jgi:hypothetical protein
MWSGIAWYKHDIFIEYNVYVETLARVILSIVIGSIDEQDDGTRGLDDDAFDMVLGHIVLDAMSRGVGYQWV